MYVQFEREMQNDLKWHGLMSCVSGRRKTIAKINVFKNVSPYLLIGIALIFRGILQSPQKQLN